mgnify:CR=1 FL=1
MPAVTAAPALLTAPGRHGGDGGGGGGGLDAKGPAGVRRGAPSETGTNASWWRKPITDASYPLTAVRGGPWVGGVYGRGGCVMGSAVAATAASEAAAVAVRF